ncbi:hypothetical protein BG011_007439, partial [Mortierella polycephala]
MIAQAMPSSGLETPGLFKRGANDRRNYGDLDIANKGVYQCLNCTVRSTGTRSATMHLQDNAHA